MKKNLGKIFKIRPCQCIVTGGVIEDEIKPKHDGDPECIVNDNNIWLSSLDNIIIKILYLTAQALESLRIIAPFIYIHTQRYQVSHY